MLLVMKSLLCISEASSRSENQLSFCAAAVVDGGRSMVGNDRVLLDPVTLPL